MLRKFVYGPGIDEPICMIVPAGQTNAGTYYYHFDGLGSVAALSNVDGEIVEKYRYDAFGNTTILSPSNEPRVTSIVGNAYMFTGREYDKETGNYYYRARYYKPSIGRFLQTDPIRYLAGLNLYSYVNNNPVNWIDPLGLTISGEGHVRCADACYKGSESTGTSSLAGCLLCCDENTNDTTCPADAGAWGQYCWAKSIGDTGITPPGYPPISPPVTSGNHVFVFIILFAILLLCKLCSIFKTIVLR